jgi:hypothetical protein
MPKAKSDTTVIRNSPLLQYDASALYRQMAFAVQAVQSCHVALVALMDDVALTKEEIELGKGLAARSKAAADEVTEILRLALHLKSSRSDLQKKILTNTCEATRVTIGWFQKFLEEHATSHQDDLAPIAKEMETLFKELNGLKSMKVEEAREMEEFHDKQKRKNRQKKASTIKHQITNEPLLDIPETPVEDAVDIRKLFDAARAELGSKEEDTPKA